MELTIGSKIGDYEVVDILGAGGMGKVYKVRNALSDRVEAMKVLLPNLAENPELADRFMREIKVQASLDHPNIAQLHTALHVNNQLLMLMEYIDGVSLEQKLKNGPLPVPQAVDAIMQVLSALEFAHARGLVHRDVKPANIMVTAGGQVKLMDFGIAKGANNDRHLTMTGTTLGSLYYMSPEQIQGASDLDARADLYSVGVTLYELVTGKRPFDGDSQFAIMSAHLEKAPIPPINIDPRLPQMLNDIILLAVAKDPNARFQAAGAMRNALSNVLPTTSGSAPVASAVPAPPAPVRTATMPTPAYGAPPPPPPAPTGAPMAANFAQSMMPPPPPPSPIQQSSGRRGLWMAIGALAAVAVAVAAIYFAPWKALTASKPQAEPVQQAQQAQQPPATPPATAPAETPAAAPAQAQPGAVPQGQQAAAPAPVQSAPAAIQSAPSPSTPKRASANAAPASFPHGNSNQVAPPPVQTAPPQQQVQPQPQQQAPPPPPEPAGPSRAEVMAFREHLAKLGVRANGIQGSLGSLERSQQSMGMNLSSKFTGPRDLMNSYMQGAQEALNANDLPAAKDLATKAERQVEILEKLLNR